MSIAPRSLPALDLEPVRMDFSGTTDATGAFTLSQKVIRQAFWSNVKIVCTAAGNPQWLAQVNGSPSATGLGPQTEMGPILVGPTERVDVIMSGANASVPVRGQFIGIQAPTLDAILQNFAPQPNTISLQQSSAPIPQGTFQVAALGTGNKSFRLPFGTLAMGIATSNNAVGNQIIVRGDTTLATYFDNVTGLNQGYVLVPVDSADDPSINVQFNSASGSTTTIYVTALLTAEAVISQLNAVQNVTLQDSSGNNISATSANSGSTSDSLFVSLERSPGAPWQRATKMAKYRAAPGAATDFTIIAAPGVSIGNYLHAGLINCNSNIGWEVTLWDGASANNVPLGEILMSQLTAVGDVPPIPLDFRGFRQLTNSALIGRLDAGQVGSTVYMHLGYSTSNSTA